MNSKISPYSSNWQKLSKKLRLLHNCAICSEKDFSLKEVHHIDEIKKNNELSNLMVLCRDCHKNIHNGSLEIPPELLLKDYQKIKLAIPASSFPNWFDPKENLFVIDNLDSGIANFFRKQNIKGFIRIGGCNFYIGLKHQGYLIGVMGFSVPDYGNYSLLMKADTTPSEWENSTDLLLYVLRTNEVQRLLEKKFSRKIDSVYSMCFSKNHQINRYRKHAELVQKIPKESGYNLGYLFQLGTIKNLKTAKSLWMQKHKIT